jgi:hypothetical protein
MMRLADCFAFLHTFVCLSISVYEPHAHKVRHFATACSENGNLASPKQK